MPDLARLVVSRSFDGLATEIREGSVPFQANHAGPGTLDFVCEGQPGISCEEIGAENCDSVDNGALTIVLTWTTESGSHGEVAYDLIVRVNCE